MLVSVFVAFMALSLAACGGTTGTPSNASNTSDSTTVQSETQVQSNQENLKKSEYYFSDNVLVSEDVRIEITDYKVIPVGETGNEYGEKPVIAFWYNTTNLSGNESVNPISAWIAMFTAIQDNDPNQVNTLEVGALPDDTFLDSQMQTIKKDGTAPCAIAYELDDTTTPVLLKATRGIGGEELGEQTFELS